MRTARQSPVPISWNVKGSSNIPSLTMLINPTNLDVSYSPVINETRTLGGFIHEYWGEQLTTLAATGKTAMFIDSEKGLTNKNSRTTEAYQNFISLLNIYKNNGKGYFKKFDTPGLKSNPEKISSLGVISMFYDGRQYDGYFENFTYTEDAEQPFNLEYSFSFKTIKIYNQLTIDNLR